MKDTDISTRPAWRTNGFVVFFVLLILGAFSLLAGVATGGLGIILLFVLLPLLGGFVIVQPNQSRVLIFFGQYVGCVNEPGFYWVNPFTVKESVSLRVHNFNSDTLKVNDADGNPIDIGVVVVWRVMDPAKSVFNVENYISYINTQSETAIRKVASHYPYDSETDEDISLRGRSQELIEILRQEVQEAASIAGIEIMRAQISHLAYSPEIAQAMLRRQQAQALIAARRKIVEGSVSMVQTALEELHGKGIVEFEYHHKAAMVNNLMVALVSEQGMQPIINTSSTRGD